MKVYILKDVYISPSGNHIRTDVTAVFSNLKLLNNFLNEHKQNLEPNYTEGNITYKNYFDLESKYLDDDFSNLYYLLYRNNLGYYNDPKIFENEVECKKKEAENLKAGINCILKKIEIK